MSVWVGGWVYVFSYVCLCKCIYTQHASLSDKEFRNVEDTFYPYDVSLPTCIVPVYVSFPCVRLKSALQFLSKRNG